MVVEDKTSNNLATQKMFLLISPPEVGGGVYLHPKL